MKLPSMLLSGLFVLPCYARADAPTWLEIRGVPEEKCDVHHNGFLKHGEPEKAVRAPESTNVFDNAYGAGPDAAR